MYKIQKLELRPRVDAIAARRELSWMGTRLRIWGSEVRILPGAPAYETARVDHTAFTRVHTLKIGKMRAWRLKALGA